LAEQSSKKTTVWLRCAGRRRRCLCRGLAVRLAWTWACCWCRFQHSKGVSLGLDHPITFGGGPFRDLGSVFGS
jgi:hypothetical protein